MSGASENEYLYRRADGAAHQSEFGASGQHDSCLGRGRSRVELWIQCIEQLRSNNENVIKREMRVTNAGIGVISVE